MTDNNESNPLLIAAANQKPSDFIAAFHNKITDRIQDLIQIKREEIGKTMFISSKKEEKE